LGIHWGQILGSLRTYPSSGRVSATSLRDRWLAGWQNPSFESHEPVSNVPDRLLERINGRISITQRTVSLAGLPESFRGLRILQLSDIHHSLFVPLEQVAAVVELSNRLQPDLVALTGDFVTYSRNSVEPVAEMLGNLRAPSGVVAVLGNHDFRVGAKVIESALRRRGIEVLRNRHVVLRRGSDSLPVAGVDDYGYGADMNRALHGIPRDTATLLLAHNPRLVGLAACHGVSLVLSGHTHGGQVNLPFLGTVYGRKPEQLRFKMGWDRLGGTQIYVSRGIGTVVLPWRWRCPAEIPHLELQPVQTDASANDFRQRGVTAPAAQPGFAHFVR
jgi:predicted MPP superfamily phosphohydrolase